MKYELANSPSINLEDVLIEYKSAMEKIAGHFGLFPTFSGQIVDYTDYYWLMIHGSREGYFSSSSKDLLSFYSEDVSYFSVSDINSKQVIHRSSTHTMIMDKMFRWLIFDNKKEVQYDRPRKAD